MISPLEFDTMSLMWLKLELNQDLEADEKIKE
jgi:hypothetical protein